MKKELLFDRQGEFGEDSSSSGNSIIKDTIQGDKGCINHGFKHTHKLSSDSKPWKIIDQFISYKHDKKSADSCFSFDQTTA
mmetsp:Transcript_15310/g.31690  ORF Transcript_15310/g.31690 Transcript_15310/m.31690 type:complete len:81 (-) Transcript_15310:288-530(-)